MLIVAVCADGALCARGKKNDWKELGSNARNSLVKALQYLLVELNIHNSTLMNNRFVNDVFEVKKLPTMS